jgi:hypothetical protein
VHDDILLVRVCGAADTIIHVEAVEITLEILKGEEYA